MFGTHVFHVNHHPYMWAVGIVGVGGVVAAASTGVLGKAMTHLKHHAENCPCMKRFGRAKKKTSALKFWAN